MTMDMEPTQWRSVFTLRDVTAVLFRQSRLVVVGFAALTAVVVSLVLLAPRVYDGELKILVQRDRVDSLVSGTPESDRSASSVSEPELLSEVELLQGYDLLEQVAVAVGLDKTPAGGKPGSPGESLANAVGGLRADLTVAPISKTWLIGVSYASKDAQQAKTVLDVLARLYLEKHLAVRRPPGAYQFFSEQSERSAEELRAAQAGLREFGDRTHVVAAAEQKENVLERLAEFESLQRQSEVALAEARRRVAALDTERGQTPARRTSSTRTSDAAGLIQELQSRILNLELKRTELLQKFTPSYRMVTEIDQQLAQARAALEEARSAPIKEETIAENPTMQWVENESARSRAELAALEARTTTLHKTVGEYRSQAQRLDVEDSEQRDLLRNLKSAEDKYLLYQRKQEEARISDAMDHTRIANVAIAQAPTVSFEPRRTISLAWLPAGVLISLILSLAAAFMRRRAEFHDSDTRRAPGFTWGARARVGAGGPGLTSPILREPYVTPL